MRLIKKMICILLAMAVPAALLCACGEPSVPPEQISQGSVTEPVSEAGYPALPAAETPSPAPTPTPEAVPEETPEPVPEITPTPRAERVEDDYFADAAFFGNSLVDGLHSCGGLQYGDFFAGTSASVISVETTKDAHRSDGTAATLLDALLEKQYGKIYILLGINELGFRVGGFTDLYAGLLDTISAAEPDAEIYVMSLTPITEKRSNSPDLFTGEKVLAFNSAIRAMVEEKGFTYLDLYAAFADENGWLPPEKSTDGVHFTTDTYQEWAEYLRTHYDGGPDA